MRVQARNDRIVCHVENGEGVLLYSAERIGAARSRSFEVVSDRAISQAAVAAKGKAPDVRFVIRRSSPRTGERIVLATVRPDPDSPSGVRIER